MSWEKGQYEVIIEDWFFFFGVPSLYDVLISTGQRSEPAICTHVSLPTRASLPLTPALSVTTEHWAEPPVLCDGPPLAICFTGGGRPSASQAVGARILCSRSSAHGHPPQRHLSTWMRDEEAGLGTTDPRDFSFSSILFRLDKFYWI